MLPVNTRNPVNWSHPLNRGKIGWWLVIPSLYGGNVWYDLAGQANAASPAAFHLNATSKGFQPTSRPGGYGHIASTGGNNSSYLSAPNFTWTGLQCTFGCWAYANALQPGYTPLFGSRGNLNFEIAWMTSSTNELQYMWNGNQYGVHASPILYCGPSSTAVGNWFFVAITINSATSVTGYVGYNGLFTSGTFAVSPNVTSGTISGLTFLQDTAVPGTRNWNGGIDDAFFYNRSLSYNELFQLYWMSQQGHTETLNRLDLREQLPAKPLSKAYVYDVAPEVLAAVSMPAALTNSGTVYDVSAEVLTAGSMPAALANRGVLYSLLPEVIVKVPPITSGFFF